jgi:succinoglycan biosynthesis protein ExoA
MLVSVIIPIFNEGKFIRRCLRSVLASEFAAEDMEVIVVDGGSTDGSRQIVEEIAATDLRLRLIDNLRQIVPTGMNAAIRVARGKYIVRMDAHAEYPANYVGMCVEELDRTGADNVGGCLDTRPGDQSLMAAAIALALQHPFGVGGAAFRVGWSDRYVDTVPFGAFPRHVFERVGLFNEEMVRHQDFELNCRIRRTGGKIFLSSKIRNVYYSRSSLSSLLRQTFLNGVWNARAWVWYPETFSCRRAIPPIFVMTLCLATAFAPFSKMAGELALLAVTTYSCSALAATLHLARRNLHCAILLPVVFLLMHLTFGAAVLSGLLKAMRARPLTSVPLLSPVLPSH